MCVYLLCFSEKYEHAQHYIGFAKSDIDARMEKHRKGHGAKLMRAVMASGRDFTIARVWEDKDRHFERKLKNRKNSKELCPICSGKKALERGLK